jgi:hypothetical protein
MLPSLRAAASSTLATVQKEVRVRTGLDPFSEAYWSPERQAEVKASTADFFTKLDALRNGERLPAAARDLTYVFVPGLLGKRLGTGYIRALSHGLKKGHGIERFIEGDVNSGAGANDAVRRLTRQAEGLDLRPRKLVWVGHSFGGPRSIRTVQGEPKLAEATRGMLFVQSPVLGSPLSPSSAGVQKWAARLMAAPMTCSPRALQDLSIDGCRKTFARGGHRPEIPTHSIATIARPSPGSVVSAHEVFTRTLTGRHTDGLVFPECAGLEGADVLLPAEVNLDHFQAVAKTMLKSHRKPVSPVELMAVSIWQLLEKPDSRQQRSAFEG